MDSLTCIVLQVIQRSKELHNVRNYIDFIQCLQENLLCNAGQQMLTLLVLYEAIYSCRFCLQLKGKVAIDVNGRVIYIFKISKKMKCCI